MALKKIEHKAPKREFLTLDELAEFVREAREAGASGSEVVEVGASFGAKLQRISVEVPVLGGGANIALKGVDRSSRT